MAGSEFYTFELNDWKGLDTRPNIADKSPQTVEDCQNVDFEQGGIIAKRRGAVQALTSSETGHVRMLYNFQSSQGFSTLSDDSRNLVIRGDVLEVFQGSTITDSFSVVDAIHYAVSSDNGACYLANESGNEVRLLYYDTVSNQFDMNLLQIQRPPMPDIDAIGFTTSGSYTSGSWRYLYTYVDKFGNESKPNAIQSATSASTTSNTYGVYFDRLYLTPSPDTSISYLKIYACHIPVTTNYHFVGVAQNINYTVSDTFSFPQDDTMLAAGSILAGVYPVETVMSTTSVSITNPGAETGDATGWTEIPATSQIQSIASEGGYSPHSGTRFFRIRNNQTSAFIVTAGMQQDIDLPAEWVGTIDNGKCRVSAEVYLNHTKIGFFYVTYLNAGGSVISNNASPFGEYTSWTRIGVENKLVPPTTRKIRLRVNDVLLLPLHYFYADDFAMALIDISEDIDESSGEAIVDDDLRGKYVAIYNNNLLIAGNPDTPDLIRISNPTFHRQFGTNAFIRVMSGDAQNIVGLRKYSDSLIIGKADSAFVGYGQYDDVFNAKELDTEYGAVGQGAMVTAQRRYILQYRDGIYVGYGGNVFEELTEVIRPTILNLNKESLNSYPTKVFACDYKFAKKVYFSVREASGTGENDTILVWDYGNGGTWSKYKGIEASYLAQLVDSDKSKFLYGGDSQGRAFLFTQNGMDTVQNSDLHTGTTSTIDAWIETPWIHLPKAVGVRWPRTLTEAAWMQLWAGGEPAGEPAGGEHITLTTHVFTDWDSETVKGTYSTTHAAAVYPAVTCEPKTISGFAGDSNVFEVIKFKVGNSTSGEHFKIHKMIFGFRARPTIER